MTTRSCPGRKAWCPSSSRAWNTSAGVSVDTGVGQHGPKLPPFPSKGSGLVGFCSPATCPEGPGG